MALFANLYHVSKVVAQLIDDQLPSTVNVQVGPPLEAATGSAEEIRVTLLWTSPQASHRNDPVALNSTGQRVQAPMTLSAFFLVTTYGSSGAQVPERAYELLGNVIQVFHTTPTVTLTNTPTLPGEGRLTVIQPAVTPELMEHVYTPLQIKHRPWVLFEVSPVQLAKLVAPEPPGAQVRPGGINLIGPELMIQPELSPLSPLSQGEQGIVRLDVDLKGKTLIGVYVGSTFVPAASLTVVHADRAYLLTLPSSAKAGQVVDVRVQTQNPADVGDPEKVPDKYSNTERLGILSPQISTINAVGAVPAASTLTLSGRALTGAVQTATQILIWPETALANPAQVKSLGVTSVTATSLQSTVTPASQGLAPGLYRTAVGFNTGAFTPFVRLELT